MAFIKLQRTRFLTRPTTHAAISTFSTSHNSISSQYTQSYSPRVLHYQKQTPIFHAANKTTLKTHFDLRHLTYYYFFILLLFFSQPSEEITTLTEETTQRKHPRMLQPILANITPTKSTAKTIILKIKLLVDSLSLRSVVDIKKYKMHWSKIFQEYLKNIHLKKLKIAHQMIHNNQNNKDKNTGLSNS